MVREEVGNTALITLPQKRSVRERMSDEREGTVKVERR